MSRRRNVSVTAFVSLPFDKVTAYAHSAGHREDLPTPARPLAGPCEPAARCLRVPRPQGRHTCPQAAGGLRDVPRPRAWRTRVLTLPPFWKVYQLPEGESWGLLRNEFLEG